MCLHTAFWRNKYAGLATAAVLRLGVDGIYMDQACSSLACFDPGHGHPLGGGTYWMTGFRELSADIRRRCDGTRHVVLAGEGVGESWLPHLDLMLSLQVSRERYAAPGWLGTDSVLSGRIPSICHPVRQLFLTHDAAV